MRRPARRAALLLLLAAGATLPLVALLSDDALVLRDRGLAELENERPQDAEATYRKLIAKLPADPLGHANLAIALLRQQRYDDALAAIDLALAVGGRRGDLLAIKGSVLEWRGDGAEALGVYQAAVATAPDDAEALFALHQHAVNLKRPDVAGQALAAIARLRPENLVVLLELTKIAVAAGDRAAASGSVLRIGELMWQGSELAHRTYGTVRAALEGDDLDAARIAVRRLENVLRVTPMFRESLRDLRTGILGVPIERFVDEPAPKHFGKPAAVHFVGRTLDSRATRGRALAIADLDGDRRGDIVRIARAAGEETDTLEVRLAEDDWKTSFTAQAPALDRVLAVDIDNDGFLDLVAVGAGGDGRSWRGDGDGGFAAFDFGFGDRRASALAAIDFDIEGDLDIALAGPGGPALLRNNLAGPLEAVGAMALPEITLDRPTAVRASDLDRDGDLDLVIAHRGGMVWLDNLRQGRFADRTAAGGLSEAPRAEDLVSADLDNDGRPDLLSAGRGLRAWHNEGGRFVPWTLLGLPSTDPIDAVTAFDADNDGRLDLATAGPNGVKVITQSARGRFAARRLEKAPKTAAGIAAYDLDADGDLDLVAVGAAGLHLLINEGGNANGYLAIRLRGLRKGNSKNNVFGTGAVVEVRDGDAYQFHEAQGDVVHLGLGARQAADVLRVVWTNGVPQNRLDVAASQTIVEKQLLKGSCPFLYVWDGEGVRFVTDLLWGSPIGLPVAPGVYADSDPGELVRVDGAAPRDGVYDLRITEELWEAAFFDHLRLWVVDHPADVAVASNLRIVPGRGEVPDRVLAARDLRPMFQALDGRGRDVTEVVRTLDEVYADGYQPSRYQGVAERPWTFTFDLGVAPNGPIRLWLDGWIFPSDASLNLALAQRGDLRDLSPRLEVLTPDGWQLLKGDMGFPAGKTKTTVVDTPALPAGARRLRIVTTKWLHWDRIAWTTTPVDHQARTVARLPPMAADLRHRGFSALVREAPNGPHRYDYARVAPANPWLPFPGRYTRFGDVLPLLEAIDDRSAILAPGDELRLRFDAGGLPPVATGQTRTIFLESHGWDKDADRNTGAGERMEPLPFRAMAAYPYEPAERFPDTPELRAYRTDWLTRSIGETSRTDR